MATSIRAGEREVVLHWNMAAEPGDFFGAMAYFREDIVAGEERRG